jgi:outer membrane protein OmpA-like peptidoglycan-associated protein
VGHTDDRGGAVHNLELSLRRADVVADVLQPVLSTAGVPVLADGRGQDEPRAANVGPDGREVPENQRLNRRVEITAVPATS